MLACRTLRGAIGMGRLLLRLFVGMKVCANEVERINVKTFDGGVALLVLVLVFT